LASFIFATIQGEELPAEERANSLAQYLLATNPARSNNVASRAALSDISMAHGATAKATKRDYLFRPKKRDAVRARKHKQIRSQKEAGYGMYGLVDGRPWFTPTGSGTVPKIGDYQENYQEKRLRQQKIWFPTGEDVSKDNKDWYHVDATDARLGRLACEIAKELLGKNSPYCTQGQTMGNYVIVTNAEKVKVGGKKYDNKIYRRHSGRPGGMKIETFKELQKRIPERIIEKAVAGMLPHNSYGRELFRRLKVYRGPEHPHEAQNPMPLTIHPNSRVFDAYSGSNTPSKKDKYNVPVVFKQDADDVPQEELDRLDAMKPDPEAVEQQLIPYDAQDDWDEGYIID
jgi:large subunit ribosomal protein L13